MKVCRLCQSRIQSCARRWGQVQPDPLPTETISNALDALTRDRSAMSLEAANREVYQLVKEGVTVSVPNRQMLGSICRRSTRFDSRLMDCNSSASRTTHSSAFRRLIS